MVQKINPIGPESANSIHQYYMDIINFIPGIVYWIDMDCLLKGCNNNFVKLLHLTNIKDMIGTPYDQMLKQLPWPKTDIKSLKKNDITVLFSKKPTCDEKLSIKNKEGTVTYYKTSRTPLFDNNNKIIGLVVVLTDITALKTLELQQNLIKPPKKQKQTIKKLDHPIRLLLVDDENITLIVEKNMFVDLGYKVDATEDGEHAATKLFSPGKYDIVFLDISLGKTSGYAVAKALRKMEENTTFNVPIIALTSHEVDVVKFDCEDYHMNAVFTKPITPEQAMEIIKKFVYHKEE